MYQVYGSNLQVRLIIGPLSHLMPMGGASGWKDEEAASEELLNIVSHQADRRFADRALADFADPRSANLSRQFAGVRSGKRHQEGTIEGKANSQSTFQRSKCQNLHSWRSAFPNKANMTERRAGYPGTPLRKVPTGSQRVPTVKVHGLMPAIS
jgi:hypothetical protein